MVDVFYYDAFQKTISPEPEGGPFVRYSDYAALEAKLAEAKAENAALRHEVDRLQTKAMVAVNRARDLEIESYSRTGAVKVRELLCDFEDFINEPPQYEELRMVRDYRHELYRKWEPLSRLILSTLEATPLAPKVTEAMVETEMVRMTVSETIRAMGANPDEQIIGELTVFDAVAVKVRAALKAAMEAGG